MPVSSRRNGTTVEDLIESLKPGDKVRVLYKQELRNRSYGRCYMYWYRGKCYKFWFEGVLDGLYNKTFYIESIMGNGVIYLHGVPFAVCNEMIVPVY